jgi:signal transduction histidine kinase
MTMRLRWILGSAFVLVATLQILVVVPLALQNLSALLATQHRARVDQLMLAASSELSRWEDDVRRSMDELAQSPALDDVARDAANVPPPSHVTGAAAQLMTPRALDVLALLDAQGRTLSSGHLPARLGDPSDPLFVATQHPRLITPLRIEVLGIETLDAAPVLVAARKVEFGEGSVWAVGGIRLDSRRAQSLARLTGAAVEIWDGQTLLASSGTFSQTGSTPRSLPIGSVAELRLHFSLADLSVTQSEVLRGFLTLAGFGLLLSLGAGFALSRQVSGPVEALTRAAQHIAKGSPGVQVDVRRAAGEIVTLVATFNKMTQELKTATDRLVASERIAAWQEVARRLAHEVNNPLTPIRLTLETLLAANARADLKERFNQMFEQSAPTMLEEVERLRRIVEEFSQFARLPRPELRELELSTLVQSITGLYADHDGIAFKVSIAPGVRVRADRDQLTQILVNLLKNADEALTGTGGAIQVRLGSESGSAILEVEDDGPGVPVERRANVFEPYTSSKSRGTGLGLAIALRIAEEHSGTLSLVETPSLRGALFRFTLPLAPLS